MLTVSWGKCPLSCPRSKGISSPSGTKFAHKKLETLSYHTVKTESVSNELESVPGRDQGTDGQT